MTVLLYISLGCLLISSVILLLNRKEFTPLHSVTDHAFDASAPLVSLCIPARDEERNIERCVLSALNQTYPNIEILVLDDQSADHTPYILECLANDHGDTLQVIKGVDKPDNWLGKQWACQQLADRSEGSVLIFIDADTWLDPDAVSRVVRTMGRDIIELLTVWPMQELRTFWEKMVFPLVYYSLLSFLPCRYVYQAPRWIPPAVRWRVSPLFSAACGQFMAFKRSAYQAIGGHQAVKMHRAEDVALARAVKKAGFRMRMYHGHGAASCRMYASERELFEGFRKNFLAGFGYNLFLFLLAGLMHLLVYLLPFFALPAGFLYGSVEWIVPAGLAATIIWAHRILLARWFRWDLSYAFLHPLGVLWFQKLGLRVLRDYFSGDPVLWKGRII